MSSDDELCSMCFAQLGDVVVAFDVTHVERFADSLETTEPPELDVAEALGIEFEASELSRRAAVVPSPRGSLRVAFGEHLHLEAVFRREIRPLPDFLSEATERAALAGYLRRKRGVAFVIDLAKLVTTAGVAQGSVKG